MTYKGQGRLERFLEFVGLIHTYEARFIRMTEEEVKEITNPKEGE